MSASYQKISRNGALIWVIKTDDLRPGVHLGIIDGECDDPMFKDGDVIAYVAREIVMITNDRDWADNRKADLKRKFGF